MSICHRCDNPACYNVDHLFVGTHRENMADMAAKGHTRVRLTHCARGHPFAESGIQTKRQRVCVPCRDERNREHQERVKRHRQAVLNGARDVEVRVDRAYQVWCAECGLVETVSAYRDAVARRSQHRLEAHPTPPPENS